MRVNTELNVKLMEYKLNGRDFAYLAGRLTRPYVLCAYPDYINRPFHVGEYKNMAQYEFGLMLRTNLQNAQITHKKSIV